MEIPQIILEIQKIIGDQATVKFVRHFGGMTISFPVDPKFFPESQECITFEDWKKLCQRFGGDRQFIPKDYKTLIAIRNRWIRHERDHGASVNELVKKYGLSNRRIISICNDNVLVRAVPAQRQIFSPEVVSSKMETTTDLTVSETEKVAKSNIGN